MCREVLLNKPYKFRPRSPERGQVWDKIAKQLIMIEQPVFRVTARSVRDRFSLLSTKQAQKLREEDRATGIDVQHTELDGLLEEILEREKEAKLELDSQDLEKKNKSEKEKATAEDVRKQALERMAKRKNDDGGKKPAKVRRSTADAVEYLREKSERDMDFKKEELGIRKREMEMAAEKQDQYYKQQQATFTAMMNQMQQQQQQQQGLQALLLSQQQQQNKILLALIQNNKDA